MVKNEGSRDKSYSQIPIKVYSRSAWPRTGWTLESTGFFPYLFSFISCWIRLDERPTPDG